MRILGSEVGEESAVTLAGPLQVHVNLCQSLGEGVRAALCSVITIAIRLRQYRCAACGLGTQQSTRVQNPGHSGGHCPSVTQMLFFQCLHSPGTDSISVY